MCVHHLYKVRFLIGYSQFFICPVSLIHHRGQDVEIPMGDKGEIGPYTAKIKGWMMDIMYGNEQHEWGVVVTKE